MKIVIEKLIPMLYLKDKDNVRKLKVEKIQRRQTGKTSIIKSNWSEDNIQLVL